VTISTDEENAEHSAMGEASMALFVCIATRAPELLEGRWRLLYERVRLEDGLWKYPASTVAEAEEGATDMRRTIDAEQIRRRWPALIAEAFLV
jgi:hypothetical protein